MTQISFYSLNKSSDDHRLLIACRLADKAYSLGHKIFIQVENKEQQRQLDGLLWDFKPSSFIPHDTSGGGTSPVEIGLTASPTHNDVLINLSHNGHKLFQQFSRINQIVGPDEESLAAGRQIYRFYLSQGLQPETHKI